MKINDLQSIAIVGPGLLGGSVALGLKAANIKAEITGIGHRWSSIQSAIDIGAIDHGSLDISDAAAAQLIILATPIGKFSDLLTQLKPHLKSKTVITDVGSTKRYVCKIARQMLPKNVIFVGSHPMAGSEKRGIDFARADLCRNATCIITPTKSTKPSARKLIKQLWTTLGMVTIEISPQKHDRILAKISHLPHLIAAALVNQAARSELQVAGTGFLDTTRVASGDVNLWNDIIASNPDRILRATKDLRKQLDKIDQAVENYDPNAVKRFLRQAKQKRDWLVKFKYQTSRFEP